MLNVEQIMGGYDSNFSYLAWDPKSKEGAVMDASVNPQLLLDKAKELGVTIKFVFIMHSHFDHLVGLDVYKQAGIPLYAHSSIEAEVDMTFNHNDILHIGEVEVTVLHAPGHRFDCVLLYGDKKVFTTDVVFVQGCGRCDLPGSEPEKMYDSLYEVFAKLPDETVVYPGHDYGPTPTSTVGGEKKENPYLTASSKEEFMATRMR